MDFYAICCLICLVCLTAVKTNKTWKEVTICFSESYEPFWNWKVSVTTVGNV